MIPFTKQNIYEFFLRQLILRALHDKLNMHVCRALATIMILSRVPFLLCFLINIEFCKSHWYLTCVPFICYPWCVYNSYIIYCMFNAVIVKNKLQDSFNNL